MDCGVITACDSNYFRGFKFLVSSIPKDIPLVLFDCGLTPVERDWCSQEKISVLPIENPIVDRSVAGWSSYNKPCYFKQSPFRYSLWIDCDCFVVKSLLPLFDVIKQHPLLIQHPRQNDYILANDPKLYQIFPVKYPENNIKINAGVIGLDTHASELLDAWYEKTKLIADSEHLRKLATWWDEGILHWSLKNIPSFNILPVSSGYNYFIDSREIKTRTPVEFIFRIMSYFDSEATILHFACRPKFWLDW